MTGTRRAKTSGKVLLLPVSLSTGHFCVSMETERKSQCFGQKACIMAYFPISLKLLPALSVPH